MLPLAETKKDILAENSIVHQVPMINDRSNTLTASEASSLIMKLVLNKIEILVPSSFVIMDEGMVMAKYPSKLGTVFQVYTDEQGSVNIAFEHLLNIATLQDLPAIKQVFEQQFNRPDITLKRAEIELINDRKFIVLEMITPAIDTEVYNLMFVTSLEDKLLIGTFNCTVDRMKEWQPIAKKILSSVRIKG